MINDVLSKQYHVTPLKDGETATFKLLSAGVIDPRRVDADTGIPRPSFSGGHSMCMRELFNDEGKGKKITIEYASGYQPKTLENGNRIEVPIVRNYQWPQNGVVLCTSMDNDLYCFLKRSYKNVNNPFAAKNKKKIFKEVDYKRDVLLELVSTTIHDDAIFLIRESSAKELFLMAQSLQPPHDSINLDQEYEVIKLSLRKLADKNPVAIINASGNNRSKLLVQMVEADKWQLIFFDNKERTWNFPASDRNKVEKICQVEAMVDRYEGLIKHLNDQKDQDLYERIYKPLQKINEMGSKRS